MRCVTRCFSCFDAVEDLEDYRDPRLSDGGGQPRGPVEIRAPTAASLAQLQPVQEIQPLHREREHRRELLGLGLGFG